MEQVPPIQRVLVGCVGESAALVLRSLRTAGIESVAIFLEESGDAPYVDDADYPVLLSANAGNDPFSDHLRLVSCAMDAAADAFHPGTRLAPPDLVQLMGNLNLGWIGPKAEHLRLGMDPMAARKFARECGIEIPQQTSLLSTPAEALAAVERLGPPLLLIQDGAVQQRLETMEAIREAATHLTTPVLFERALRDARLLRVTVVGDGVGGVVAFPEMEDVIVQSGHVLMRECPAVGINQEGRSRILNQAAELAHRCQFLGVMTVEFQVTPDGIPWFHRLWPGLPEGWWLVDQVSGVDLVGAQVVLARGEGLGWEQDEVTVDGCALHLSIVATEAGVLERFSAPEGADMLLLRGEGAELKAGDSLVAFRVHASSHHAALVKAQVLLQHVEVDGVATSLPFLRDQLADKKVWEGPRMMPLS